MKKFKVGDMVVCVDNIWSKGLSVGRTYEVSSVLGNFIEIKYDEGCFRYDKDKFELVKSRRDIKKNMTTFSIGDVVECIDNMYDRILKVGNTYEVYDVFNGNLKIKCNDEFSIHNKNRFKKVRNRKKSEYPIRYMVYGTGCNNKSHLYLNERIMSNRAREVIGEVGWTGDIIGYKLVPIFKVENKTILKKFKNEKHKEAKKGEKK